MNVTATVAEVTAALRAEGQPARAAHEQRYLKSDLTFLGVPVPGVRRAAKAFVRAHPDLDAAALRALATALWRTRTHELRSFAIGVLELEVARLSAKDCDFLIDLVDSANTWAHVDWLATKVIGGLVARTPSLGRKPDAWAKHPNFWVRRTALLVFHDPLMAGKGDFDHFARLAASLLGEREFFIRKAIGWVLREAVKKTPALTIGFVERHAAALSPLSFREATRNLPAAEQKRLAKLRAQAA